MTLAKGPQIIGWLSQSNTHELYIKFWIQIQSWKEEITPSRCVDYMILYIENAKEFTKKLLEYTSSAKYRIQYTYIKIYCISSYLEWKIWKWNDENNSIYNRSKRIEYLGEKLTKAVQNLYSEDYKFPLKEIKNLTK